jgi:hypothetical protein
LDESELRSAIAFPHPLSCQSSYSETTVILREGYGRNSAIKARVIIPDSGVSDHGESEVQMNKSTDENKQAFVGACGTSGVQPLWEADEIANEIDRMIEEGGKDSPEQLSLND